MPLSLTSPPRREPDSTYYEMPPGSHPGGHHGERGNSSNMAGNRAEVCMDVYHMRDMNDNVMVRMDREERMVPSILEGKGQGHYISAGVVCNTYMYHK